VADPHGSSLGVLQAASVRPCPKGLRHRWRKVATTDWFDCAAVARPWPTAVDITPRRERLGPGTFDRTPRYAAMISRIEQNWHRADASPSSAGHAIANSLARGRAYHLLKQVAALVSRRIGRAADAVALMQFSAQTFDKRTHRCTRRLARVFEFGGNVDSSARSQTQRALAPLDFARQRARASSLGRRLGLRRVR